MITTLHNFFFVSGIILWAFIGLSVYYFIAWRIFIYPQDELKRKIAAGKVANKR